MWKPSCSLLDASLSDQTFFTLHTSVLPISTDTLSTSFCFHSAPTPSSKAGPVMGMIAATFSRAKQWKLTSLRASMAPVALSSYSRQNSMEMGGS